MKKEISLILTPSQAHSEETIKSLIAKDLGIETDEINSFRIIRKSIDARGNSIKVNIKAEVVTGDEPLLQPLRTYNFEDVSKKPEIVIIGAGPAGLFAALRIIELGYRPVLIERGERTSRRKKDIDLLENDHILKTDSNYCFGEGGAGTFSDGKLYTRVKKRGDIGRVLELLYQFGANENILYESHPHIGSDKLPEIISNISNTIEQTGGTLLFNSRVVDIGLKNGEISHILTNQNEKITGKAYILTTGHSARDIYYLLNCRGIAIEAKPFAMGVRVEHPQEMIDNIQYHNRKTEYLPAASYNIVEQVENRGVYSFCMCPGGQIVPAATNEGEIVVNGMSLSRRNSAFANSGIVVQILPSDFQKYQNMEGLAGMRLQELFEQKAFRMVNNRLKAPAQRLTDYVNKRDSQDLPVCSYLPGITNSPMHEWMPDFIKVPLQAALKKFNTTMKGFLSREAIMVGVESRTSSPVRIPRDPEKGNHIQISNLFPAGEGAGYAGGIVSSAMDGESIAVQCFNWLQRH